MYSVIGGDGQVYGPVNTDTLVEWSRAGRLTAKTSLIDPINGAVLSADTLPELRAVFLTAPPVVPPVAPPSYPSYPAAQPTYPSQPYPNPPQGSQPIYPNSPGQGYAQGYAPGTPYTPQQTAFVPQNGYPGQYPAQYPGQYAVPVAFVMYPAVSPKTKVSAALLCFFLGSLGAHRFYLGYTGSAICQLLLGLSVVGLPVVAVWTLIDLILILTGGLKDSEQRVLS